MDKKIAVRMGLWSAVYVAALGAIYLLLLIIFFASEGFAFPPSAFVQLAGGVITFLTAPGLVALFTAIRYAGDEKYRALGSLGISFIVLFAAMVSINRFVQLTVIQQAGPGAASADLARFLPYSAGSVMFALEILGWGFFSSLAAACVAPMFSGAGLERAIRWLLILYAIFSALAVIGFVTKTPITAGAFLAWGPILLAVSILLAVHFRRAGRA